MSNPSLFISHGAPNLVLDANPASAFLRNYAESLSPPDAIVVASAHFASDSPAVSADAKPEMIYDFGGFEPELYEMVYPAPGNPELASGIVEKLRDAGFEAAPMTGRGYDHGTWVPLMLLFPQARIPVVQVSVQPNRSPEHHYRMGAALRDLYRDNVLVIGSGSLTHNLQVLFSNGMDKNAETPEWVHAFADWMHERVAAGDIDELLDYRDRAPYAKENHPTDEHLLPFFVAAGAGRSGGKNGERVHASNAFGVLAMDAYAFH